MVEFRVLGGIEVSLDGDQIDVGPARQQCVLAALLVDANSVVSAERLIDRVWGDHPPLRARTSLHSYLTRLRRALATAPVSITRRAGNYVLNVDEQNVDMHRFRDLLGRVRATADDARALALIEQALGLWRGEAFSGLDTPWLHSIRTTLERERLEAAHEYVDLLLRQGRHAVLLPELRTRVEHNPLDERLAGQLMLAFYRSGRQADALAVFQDTRRRLGTELGLEPGPELRRLQEQILHSAPDLEVAPARELVPRNNLPGDVPDFTGREAEMVRLLAAVPRDGVPGVAVVIEAIDGMAGVGKTALAVHHAHRLTDHYPDAQLFVDLHGHTAHQTPTDPMTALDALLRAWGVPGDQIPQRLEERAARWRAELADRKAVIILDNAANAAQIRPLLPGGARCLTLITSRLRLVDLDVARVLSLDVLPQGDAITMFLRVVDDRRSGLDSSAVEEVVALCGNLPLAIRIAGARLRTRPAWTARHLADRLRDRHRRLTELAAGDRSVAAAFSLSYQHLTSSQQRMFRLLGLHCGPDTDSYAAASLAGIDLNTAERLLEELVDAHLLDQPRPVRYRFHDLLRHHADTTAHATETPDAQRDSLTRLVDFYLHTAFRANRLLDSQRAPIQLRAPEAGCVLRRLESISAAMTWFEVEHDNLLAVQNLAAERNWHLQAWQLAWTLSTFHQRRGRLQDYMVAWQVGLAASACLSDTAAQMQAHRFLGHACGRLGRHGDSIEHHQRALALAEHVNDLSNQALAHRGLASGWAQQGDHQRALDHATQAKQLFRALGNPAGQAYELNGMGWYEAQLGRYAQARIHCEAALTLHRDHPDPQNEADTLDSLGYIAHHAGQLAEALDYYHRALTLFRDLGNTYQQANTLEHLAQTHDLLGHQNQARVSWQQALELYQAQHRTADADRLQRRLASVIGSVD
jgi:DNA-binding SARP family transcriptional activator/tetratricopeptide (TPR) repeat protein